MPKWEFKLKGARKIEQALDPRRFDKTLKKHLRRASALNGKIAEAMVRDTIQNGPFAPNKPLTTLIKGSEKPLVDKGDLFQSVTSRVMKDGLTVFVGVLKTAPGFNIAVVVHEGAEIGVTAKMRGLFFILWQASIGATDPSELSGRAADLFERFQDWKPLSPSTSAIIISARPFIKETFKNKKLRKAAVDNWRQAMRLAFAEQAKAAK